MAVLKPVTMPKWGLSMQEGTIVAWAKPEGAPVGEGEALADIETSKITNVFEAPASGVLRRIVAREGETVPVGALIAVLADADAGDSEIDAFVGTFAANFTPEQEGDEGAASLALDIVEALGRAIQIGRAGEGEGPPVVLLHGFSGDLNNWLFNIDAMAANGPVIAFDLPGHGGSSKDVGDGSLATLSAIIRAALERLGVAKAHLVGHSLGGAIAARIAADAPQSIASLTLICPASLPGTSVSAEFLNGVVEARRARDLKPFLEMLFADPALVSKDMVENLVKFKRIDGVEDALSRLRDRLVDGNDKAALARDLHNIPAATIIASRSDKIVGAPDANALPSGFRMAWIEGAGHMPHLEKAADVNAILSQALR